MLTRLIAPFVDTVRRIVTTAPRHDTEAELARVEREIEMDDVPEAVRRIRRCVGHGVYCLGAGGKRPDATDPYSLCVKPKEHRHAQRGRVFCDCSGAVCWALEIPRLHPVTKRWLNTDELERLARLVPIAWEEAIPGDVLVYGAGAKIGHCGVVTEADSLGPSRVAHCSARGTVAFKEESPELFRRARAAVFRKSVHYA